MSHGKQKNAAPELSRIEIAASVSASAARTDAWQVEATQQEAAGDALVAIFVGPQARERATEYAFAKFAAVLE
ncbi:MAG: hypothetical protein V4864_17330 [Pseudomonadota bacterium]